MSGRILAIGLLAICSACGSSEPVEQTGPQTVAAIGAPIGDAADPPEEDDLDALMAAAEAPAVLDTTASRGSGNHAPRLSGIQVDPGQQMTAGGTIRVTAHASDAEGQEVEYLYTWWVNGDEADPEGAEFSTEGLKRGDTVRVEVVASDGRASSPPLRSPEIQIVNGLPAILSQPGGIDADGVFRYQVRAEDPDSDRNLRYRLESGPPGMKISGVGGLVEWEPRQGQYGATHPVAIVVEDSLGAGTAQRFELSLDQDSPPAAPAR